ncbi:MAG TPA: acetyl-CoA carboxylase biotin carboxyl carrier protein [Gemmatimonadaceae bacterium]|nr:acetyl-CoA carboxylase biotin carboxyl carrier protein [Gemmatimonadaceae bacterium]
MIDLRYVKKLIEMLDGSTVDSIEISSDKGMRLRLSKTAGVRAGVPLAAPVTMTAPAPHAAAAAPAPAPAVAEVPAAPERRSAYLEVKSPMVGTFYSAPEPGARPYLAPGDRIQKGQVLCIIEAMKIMNEIESEFAGTVVEVLAEDAHPVEYGQILFRIDPNG